MLFPNCILLVLLVCFNVRCLSRVVLLVTLTISNLANAVDVSLCVVSGCKTTFGVSEQKSHPSPQTVSLAVLKAVLGLL
jgi:hypothetical protein